MAAIVFVAAPQAALENGPTSASGPVRLRRCPYSIKDVCAAKVSKSQYQTQTQCRAARVGPCSPLPAFVPWQWRRHHPGAFLLAGRPPHELAKMA